MVINLYKNGQLGNRLLHITAFIVNSIDHNYAFYYLTFPLSYQEYFDIHKNSALLKTNARFRFSRIEPLNKILVAVSLVLFKISEKARYIPFLDYLTVIPKDRDIRAYCDLNDPRFIKMASRKLLFIEGWRFVDPDNMLKYLPLIRDIFKPIEKYMNIVNTIIQTALSFGNTLVGVHIRKGDYKNYHNGKWYYSNQVYVRFMKEMQMFLAQENNPSPIVFIICSDEAINTNEFFPLPVLYVRKSEIIDLYTLSKCNYIIAPPSTFSGWASYYGSVPIYYIDNPEASFCKDNITIGFHQHFTSKAQHCKNYYDIIADNEL